MRTSLLVAGALALLPMRALAQDAASAADQPAPDQGSMANMDMKGMDMSGMTMSGQGSGTSRLPGNEKMGGEMVGLGGGTMLMLHGYVWPIYTHKHTHSEPLDWDSTRIFFYLYVGVTERNTETGGFKR